MNRRSQVVPVVSILAMSVTAMIFAGCNQAPGYPKQGVEVPRPENVLDFATLYKSNCAGCHGENGRGGAALPLNNPSYLAVAGNDTLQSAIAKGVSGTLMPPFAKSAGGMLTDRQVQVLSQGILQAWSRPAQFAGVTLPAYDNGASSDAANGQKIFTMACARCHGVDGMGLQSNGNNSAANRYAIADPNYLALVNDQTLRSFILGGRPDEGMPDWRGYLSSPQSRALTSQEITDIVAWLASHRTTGTAPAASMHP